MCNDSQFFNLRSCNPFIQMSEGQSPICPNCSSWLLDHPTNPDYLKCISCGCCVKINKRIVKPVGYKKK